ncbi:type II toxin-antitoxin system RelB/DinJ family antitoxin [Blautia sp.]
MTTISLRMDDETKKELDEMCEAMGMNISTFYMIYTKKALRDRRIPFEIEAPADPFYSEKNMSQFRKSLKQAEQGKVVVKTMEELEAMAGE